LMFASLLGLDLSQGI